MKQGKINRMDPRSASDEPAGPPAETRADLSDREREILVLVATGASNKQIAQQLVISPNTVKVHLRNVFAKINVASRTEAALYAIREGLVQVNNGEAPAVAADDEASNGAAAETVNPPVASGEAATLAAPTPQQGRWGLWLTLSAVALVLVAGAVWIMAKSAAQRGAPNPTAPVPTLEPRWTIQSGLPTARAGLAVVTYENQVYAIAGETADGITGVVERLDPTTNAWDTRATKPQAVADVSAAVIGGQVYVPGGRLASGALTDTLAVYDPATDQWSTRASLPAPVSGYALVAFEGQLYLFGGWDGQRYLDQTLLYDPDRDEWHQLPAMPTARAFAGAAVASGQIFVVGGEAGSEPLAVNEVFQPQGQHPWVTRAPLPAGRTQLGVTSLADSIYAVGGKGAVDEWGAWSYLPSQDIWRPLESWAGAASARLGLTAWQSKLVVLGGEQAGVPSSLQLIYQAIYTTIFPGVSGE
jgi:DNA-binding CsgD family transcriptional regulator